MNQIDERRGATSASNAGYDIACPGRHLAQRGLKSTATKDSAIGDRIHAALALRNPDGLSVDEQRIYSDCCAIEFRLVQQFFGEDSGKAKSFREDPKDPGSFRFWVTLNNGDNGAVYEHSCRPDVMWRYLDRALILEYKTLAGEVPDSPNNLQLRDQQCILRGHFLITGEIGVAIIQPMVNQNPAICVYTDDDSKVATEAMFKRVVASNGPNSPRIAGAYQCNFCLAKSICSEHAQWISASVPVLRSLDTPVTSWTAEQRRTFCDLEGVARKWLDDCWQQMIEGTKRDPNFVEGYRVKPGVIRESIKDPQATLDRFIAAGGTLETFIPTITVGKTRLKEALSKQTGLIGQKLDKALKELLDGLTESKQTAPTLVKADEVKQ
jgi:hypothetical protein